MKLQRCPALFLIALILSPGSAASQAGNNIAGTYRGLMTGCFTAPRPADCREGFKILIPLADDVDARRIALERAAGTSAPAADQMRADYELARTRLSEAIDKFNRDMAASPQ